MLLGTGEKYRLFPAGPARFLAVKGLRSILCEDSLDAAGVNNVLFRLDLYDSSL